MVQDFQDRFVNGPYLSPAMVRVPACGGFCAIVLLALAVLRCADGKKPANLIKQKISSGSFIYNSQVNNDQGWKIVPKECTGIVGVYMEGPQYRADAYGYYQAAQRFLRSVQLEGDGKDVVVFDVDETALSNLPHYRKHKYGGEAFNSTTFNLWVSKGTAPAIPATLQLFITLKAAKIATVFLTGRFENQREITTMNLLRAGYKSWTELIFSVGDQWSHTTGPTVGARTFKVPNPMYFIA